MAVPRCLLRLAPHAVAGLLFVLIFVPLSFGGCITPVPGNEASASNDPFTDLRRETVGALPVLATRPSFRKTSTNGAIGIGWAAGGIVGAGVAAAIAGHCCNDHSIVFIDDVVDPTPAMQRSVQELLGRRFGVRFVPARERDYKNGDGGRRSEAAPPFSLSVVSRGYGLTMVENDPNDRGVYYWATIALTAWGNSTSQDLVATRCRLESKWVMSVRELERPGSSVWVQQRVKHLANRCVRLFEEEICRHESPHLKPEQCATSASEASEIDDDDSSES